jgi:hypothetical protein
MIRELIVRLQAAWRAFLAPMPHVPARWGGELEEPSNVREFHPARRWRG